MIRPESPFSSELRIQYSPQGSLAPDTTMQWLNQVRFFSGNSSAECLKSLEELLSVRYQDTRIHPLYQLLDGSGGEISALHGKIHEVAKMILAENFPGERLDSPVQRDLESPAMPEGFEASEMYIYPTTPEMQPSSPLPFGTPEKPSPTELEI